MSLYANGHKVAPILNASDFYATINVTTQEDVNITIAKAIRLDNTNFKTYKKGTYTIIGTYGEYTNSTTVTVSGAVEYPVSLYLWSTIVISGQVGSVVTCEGVTKTITDTSVSFKTYTTGSKTITAVCGVASTSLTINVTALGQTYTGTLVYTSVIKCNAPNGTYLYHNGYMYDITTGYKEFEKTSIGTYSFMAIYNGNAEILDVTISTIGENPEIEFTFSSSSAGTVYTLPSTHQAVKWIASDGNAMIDSGYVFTDGLIAATKVRTAGTLGRTIGAFNSSAPYNRTMVAVDGYGTKALMLGNGGTGYWLTNNDVLTWGEDIFLYGDGYGTNHILRKDNVDMYIYSTGGTVSGSKTTATVGILGTKTQTTYYPSNGSEMYFCVLWDGNTMVRLMVPCYQKSDTTVKGMYDIVNNVMYTNCTGNGEFNLGSDL